MLIIFDSKQFSDVPRCVVGTVVVTNLEDSGAWTETDKQTKKRQKERRDNGPKKGQKDQTESRELIPNVIPPKVINVYL